jgi:hypothetical protein
MRLLRIAALFAVAVLLAGCGGGGGGGEDNGVADKTADEIVADATAAAKSASSVYVHGSTTSGDQPLVIDVHLVKDKGGTGHLEVNGFSVEIVRVGNTAYFKGDNDFWAQFGGAAAAALFKDKWVSAPADSGDLASLTPLTDISQLFDGILGQHGKLEKGGETDVNGTPAIKVEDTEQDGTLYVATEGEPYPLKLEGGDQKGSIEFEDWDKSYDFDAPEDAVDLGQLAGGSGGTTGTSTETTTTG